MGSKNSQRIIIWEIDFYRRPLKVDDEPLWELIICEANYKYALHEAFVLQSDVDSTWVEAQLNSFLHQWSSGPPLEIRVFRPQTLALLEPAAAKFDLTLRPTRYTPTIKQQLIDRATQYPEKPEYSGETYDPVAVDQPPPVPIPENLWGEQWRFASLTAQDFQDSLNHEPIPIKSVPPDWLPLAAGLSSEATIPGLIIDAGRQAMALALWLQDHHPGTLAYIPGPPDGVLLTASLNDRWILTTFDDADVQAAARTFTERKIRAQGIHFLLVRPDDSGMTYTGLWLLRQ